ncbi:MAG: invasion associated locus B family protein [Acetobacteraceae bacterium]|nr:invasion associated locus B family protein [Acetobacteraceae bacterium]
MRAIPFLTILTLVVASPAMAQTHRAAPAAKPAPASNAPKQLGKFEDWTAATHQESGATVCYAFTRAQSSAPALPGRGEVILTVTQRAAGRDVVAISAGFPYAQGATVTVQIEQAGHDFYTAGRNAFARDGKATVAALQRGSRAIARSPGPHEAQVTDTFSLKGFSPAYAATVKACPPK